MELSFKVNQKRANGILIENEHRLCDEGVDLVYLFTVRMKNKRIIENREYSYKNFERNFESNFLCLIENSRTCTKNVDVYCKSNAKNMFLLVHENSNDDAWITCVVFKDIIKSIFNGLCTSLYEQELENLLQRIKIMYE